MNRQQTELLRSALAMAGRGWYVFPCAPGGKEPGLRGNWQHHATTDPAQVRAWWTSRPPNIGLPCRPSSLVVMDLDAPKAPNQAERGRCAREAVRPGRPVRAPLAATAPTSRSAGSSVRSRRTVRTWVPGREARPTIRDQAWAAYAEKLYGTATTPRETT